MHPVVKDRLDMRRYARSCGDVSLERACDADLTRYGWAAASETVVDDLGLERAVPERPKRGRPPRPRCEHGQIVGRCSECDDEELIP